MMVGGQFVGRKSVGRVNRGSLYQLIDKKIREANDARKTPDAFAIAKEIGCSHGIVWCRMKGGRRPPEHLEMETLQKLYDSLDHLEHATTESVEAASKAIRDVVEIVEKRYDKRHKRIEENERRDRVVPNPFPNTHRTTAKPPTVNRSSNAHR